MDNEEKEELIFSMEKGVTSLYGLLGEWRMENGERRHAVKPSPRILHSSPEEEKKLGFSFSENGPSTIQGEGATSPFSDLREWEERGVTTPIVGDARLRCIALEKHGSGVDNKV